LAGMGSGVVQGERMNRAQDTRAVLNPCGVIIFAPMLSCRTRCTQGLKAMSKPTSNLWQRAWHKLEPDVESWLVDMGRYALLFLGLVSLFLLFKLLRSIGINSPFIDTLEKWDHVGTAIIFVVFVVTLIRRAIVSLFSSGK
jgi:hypothetical protein